MSRPLTMDQAAAELGVSRRWLTDFLRTAPRCWLAAGRKKLFDEAALTILREGGYRFPDHVLQAVNEDIDESSPSSHPPADGFNGEDNDAN